MKTILLIAALAARAAEPPAADEARCRDLLNAALADKSPDTRKQAAAALSLIGPREPFLSRLESLLEDKDAEVRLAAVSSLAELKTPRTVRALRKALKDDVPEVGFSAAKALWAWNDAEGKDALQSMLIGETKVSSGFLSKQKRDAMRMMHTPKTLLMFAAKQGAGLAPVPGLGAGFSSVQGLVSDSGTSARATVALLLARDDDPETIQALREALRDREWSVRAAAIHSLAMRNRAGYAREILPLLEDKKEAVRLRAAAGWLRLQTAKSRAARSFTAAAR